MFSFFRKRPDKKSEAPTEISNDLGIPEVNHFNQMLQKSFFQEASQFYSQSPWFRQSLMAEGSGLSVTNFDRIKEWHLQMPHDFVASLMWGVALTGKAWRVRGSGAGSTVSEDDAVSFTDLLEEAMEAIQASDQQNEQHAETCARAIRVCMGLGLDEPTTMSFFEAGKGFEPEHLHLHLMMANYLTPKWRGSKEALHAFAKENFEQHPHGHLVVLPLFAIVEEALYYGMTDQSEKEKQVWLRIDYRELSLHLFDQYSRRSVADSEVLAPIVFNYFSYVFYQQKRTQLARQALEGMQNHITTYPWSYEGIDSIQMLQKLL